MKAKRILAAILSACLLAGVLAGEAPIAANAAGWYYSTWPNNARMKNGVGSWGSWKRSYWIDSSAMECESDIVQARNEWVNTSSIQSTSIDIQRTYTKSDAVFEVQKTQEIPSVQGIFAETHFYEFADSPDKMDGGKKDPSRNYYWTVINLNTSNFASLGTNVGGLNHKKGTIAHEFGHAFGLAHLQNDFPYVIMCTTGGGRHVDSPQKDDLVGINYLYG